MLKFGSKFFNLGYDQGKMWVQRLNRLITTQQSTVYNKTEYCDDRRSASRQDALNHESGRQYFKQFQKNVFILS